MSPPPTSRPRAWVMAARPKTLLAAVAPVAVGWGLAVGRGVFAAGPAVAALLGGVLIQIGTNLANDYHDFVRGSDTRERVGPVRVTQAGILAPEAVARGAWLVFGAAVLVGLYLVWAAGWPVVVLGLVSIAAGLAYTAGPFPLAYHALGDVFVLIFFGPVAVAGTYYVQALSVAPDAILAGLAMGCLNTAILVANNLRDLPTDREAGKRTLAVVLGPEGTRLEYLTLLAAAFLAPALGIYALGWSRWTALALLAGPLAIPPLRRVVTRARDPEALVPALAQTARLTGAYGVLLAVGLALG